MRFYGILSIMLVLDLLTALFARQAYNESNNFFLMLAMLSLTFAGYLFIKLLKYEITAVVNALWISFGTIFVTIGSYMIFQETITFTQGVGMSIIVLGMIITEVGAPKEEPSPEKAVSTQQ